ncbi:hypothetical protein A7X67_18615 [Clostridium sp. W14A]|jgi:galactofuranosylgalactofuranosylrhamnosyl-N-acetylglucosaminyl-diphospho-decaprenol beta-1,5/1,6-galactofuranosyltransferase|nr:hypothetical protein A7X67_18615 [Clostridium sp. W14A]
MTIQTVLIHCPQKGAERLLYKQPGNDLPARIVKNKCFLYPNTIISFDTYYNSFSYGRFLQYTCLTHIKIRLHLQGSFIVRVINQINENEAEILLRKKFYSNQPIWFEHLFDISNHKSSENGYYYFELTAGQAGGTFFGGEWAADIVPYQKVKVAVNICTFHREMYVTQNVNRIAKYFFSQNKDISQSLEIFIIDNGKTISPDQWKDNRIHVIKNTNYGGSGGFTRGLIEANCRSKEFTHIIFQDDDIILAPESIARTISFLSIMKDPLMNLCVAGGMFSRESPLKLCEAGARWKGYPLSLNQGIEMDTVQGLIQHNTYKHADYGAWWYFCMPLWLVNKNQLPIPFFIKYDDVEYGIRNSSTIITLNGVGVWHESFKKKYNFFLEYYITRNALVTDAVHPSFYSLFCGILQECKSYLRCLIFQNYIAAQYHDRALSDFLKGISFFETCDEEQLNHKLQEENIQWITSEEIERETGISPQRNLVNTEKVSRLKATIKVLVEYIIPRNFPNRDYIVISWDDEPNNLDTICGCQNIIHYSKIKKAGYFSKGSKYKFWKLAIKFYFKILITILAIPYLNLHYRTQIGRITSLSFWKKHLRME